MQDLAAPENRALIHRITCIEPAGSKNTVKFIDLEPSPPEQSEQGMASAAPFPIARLWRSGRLRGAVC